MKNCIDMPIISQSEQSSLWLFVPGTSQINFYPTRETVFANCVTVFSLAVPRTKYVLGMEDIMETLSEELIHNRLEEPLENRLQNDPDYQEQQKKLSETLRKYWVYVRVSGGR